MHNKINNYNYNEYLKDLDIKLGYYNLSNHKIYPIMFPTSIPKKLWKKDLIPQFHLKDNEFNDLINTGFSIADTDQYNDSIYFDCFKSILNDQKHFIMDTNYGMLINTKNDGIHNFPLDIINIYRNIEKYPWLNLYEEPQNIFSVGNIIAQTIKNCNTINFDNRITYHVSSRNELDKIIYEWQNLISLNPNFQLWFRGQNKEYIVKNPKYSLVKSICPWRNVEDVSVSPSIFRLKDEVEYTNKLYETYIYLNKLSDIFVTCLKDTHSVFESSKPSILPAHLDIDFMSVEHHYSNGESDVTDYRFAYASTISSLFQQHYGLESPLLDLTSDLDVSLFFAQNKLNNNKYTEFVNKGKSVIYLFLLDKTFDPIIDSAIIMQDVKAMRPVRQKCGILVGANNFQREFYSRFVSVKIVLDDYIEYDKRITPEYLFPNEQEDNFLGRLINIDKEIEAQYVRPFVLDID